MIINSVVKNEALRNGEMIQQYEKLISELPKGSLICRKNSQNIYIFSVKSFIHTSYSTELSAH